MGLPGFSTEYIQGALSTREGLNMLRKESTLDLSFLSPPFRRRLSGPTDKQVSAWFGPNAEECGRNEPLLARTLCGGRG